MKKYYLFIALFLVAYSYQGFGQLGTSHFLYPGVAEITRTYNIPFVETPPEIDGDVSDEAWNAASWFSAQTYTDLQDWLNSNWALGVDDIVPPEGAFAGQSDLNFEFKIVWDGEKYYMLTKHIDDQLIYSDYHNGYPGGGSSHPFTHITIGNRNPLPGTGDGTIYQAWRMDQISYWMADYKPEYLESFNRNNQGIWNNMYLGAVTSTNDTAVIYSPRNADPFKRVLTGEAAGNYNPETGTTLIELAEADSALFFMFGRDPVPGDTILLNGEINEADGTRDMRDYALTFSTEEGNGNSDLSQAIMCFLGSPPNFVYNTIARSEDHETFESAILAAELNVELIGTGPYTVFAPNDAAFEALPEGTLDALLSDPFGELAGVLAYHIVSGSGLLAENLTDGLTLSTLKGTSLTVTVDGERIFINDAEVIVSDLEADNGVVHVIDAVLSDKTSIGNHIAKSAFNIYPNPNRSDFLNINKITDISIFDITGRLKVRSENKALVDISFLEPGIYMVKDERSGSALRLVKE